jgi:hypothetical protein
MKALYNLPPFDEAQTEFTPPKAGRSEWFAMESNLRVLARSLKVGEIEELSSLAPVRAVPDAWAQARLFGEALLDRNHSMHTAYKAQWRGLLALFALQGVRENDYEIARPQVIPLDSSTTLGRVLAELPPQDSIDKSPDVWKSVSLFAVRPHNVAQRHVFALSNPICLVSPGRLAHEYALPTVAWYQNAFKDPLTLSGPDALPSTHITILKAWLSNLIKSIEVHSQGDNPTAARIKDLLFEYATACAQRGESRFAAGPVLASPQSLSEALMQPFKIVNPAGAQMADSCDALLTLRSAAQMDGAAPDLKGIILVDDALVTALQKQPQEIYIWGTTTLGELLASSQKLQAIKREAAEYGYWIVTIDDLFTRRAVSFFNDPPTHKMIYNPTGFEEMFVPLRPITLLLEADRLKLACQKTREDAIVTATLDLLKPVNGITPQVTLKRIYTDIDATPATNKDAFILLNSIVEFERHSASVWPDFVGPHWHTHCARLTYSVASRQNGCFPSIALSSRIMGILAREIPDAVTSGAGAVTKLAFLEGLNKAAMPEASLTIADYQRSTTEAASQYDEMIMSKAPFEAVFYVEAYGSRALDSIGYACLRPAVIGAASPVNNPVLAVDFGTTNTVASADIEKPIVFKNRLMLPVVDGNGTSGRIVQKEKYEFANFFPPDERPTPIPTVAWNRLKERNTNVKSYFNRQIYFHWKSDQIVDETKELRRYEDIARDKLFNLKWNEHETHDPAKDYLEQFMLMVAAEVASTGVGTERIDWRFSAPNAMPKSARTALRDMANEIIETFDGNQIGELHSEGLASAKYILEGMGTVASPISIILDIGGGTTDITIWAGDPKSLAWNGSVKLAGGDFFTQTLINNPNIFKEIDLNAWFDLFTKSEGMQNRKSMAELLFSGPRLSSQMETFKSGIKSKLFAKPLRIAAIVFIAGIAWYCGIVARKLIEDGKIKKPALGEKPLFALCGRGAGLFRLLHGSDGDSEGETLVTRALEIFNASIGLELGRPQLARAAGGQKLEVVNGMLLSKAAGDISTQFGNAKTEYDVPSGLGLRTEGEGEAVSISSMQPLSSDPSHRIVGESIDFEEFTNFLAALEDKCSLKVNLHLDSGRAQNPLARIRDAVKNRVPEKPPFIVALETLLADFPTEAKKLHTPENQASAEFI